MHDIQELGYVANTAHLIEGDKTRDSGGGMDDNEAVENFYIKDESIHTDKTLPAISNEPDNEMHMGVIHSQSEHEDAPEGHDRHKSYLQAFPVPGSIKEIFEKRTPQWSEGKPSDKPEEDLGVSDQTKQAEVGLGEIEHNHICKESVYCKKGFKTNSELQNHIVKFHTEMGKQFSCISCKKRFARKQQLTVHIKTHSKEIVKCKICDEVKKDNLRLKIHMDQYHSKYVSICPKCKRTFETRIQFRKHNKNCARLLRQKQIKEVTLLLLPLPLS